VLYVSVRHKNDWPQLASFHAVYILLFVTHVDCATNAIKQSTVSNSEIRYVPIMQHVCNTELQVHCSTFKRLNKRIFEYEDGQYKEWTDFSFEFAV